MAENPGILLRRVQLARSTDMPLILGDGNSLYDMEEIRRQVWEITLMGQSGLRRALFIGLQDHLVILTSQKEYWGGRHIEGCLFFVHKIPFT